MRQMMLSTKSQFSCPPLAVFDEVLEEVPSSHADIRLHDFQSALVNSIAMREALDTRLELMQGTLVASPPKQRAEQAGAMLAALLEEVRTADGADSPATVRRKDTKGPKGLRRDSRRAASLFSASFSAASCSRVASFASPAGRAMSRKGPPDTPTLTTTA